MSLPSTIKKYFEERRKALSMVMTHDRHSVADHCEEVALIFTDFFKYYRMEHDVLLAAGLFLSYYHDLGKIRGLPSHSEGSYQELRSIRSYFEEIKEPLWWLLLYLVKMHHGSLRRPWPGDLYLNDFIRLNWKVLFNSLRSEYGLSAFDFADVFGLFKLADIISAKGEDHGRFLKRLSFGPEAVKNLMKSRIDEDRWREQLELRSLPGLSLLRAPTGWGKTTASLLFASSRPDGTRVFFLLPTITAINEFYEKLCKTFGEDSVDRYFYLYDAEVAEDEERLRDLIFARSFLKPIIITTVDQLILTFMQLGKYHLRRAAFRGSTLIFDEVHLLTPSLLLLTTYFIKKYASKYGLRCLFMSATFPDAYRQFFQKELEAYFKDLKHEYLRRRRILFELRNYPLEKALQEFIDSYEKGRRVLVVCNTVAEAVKIARRLYESFGSGVGDIILLHGRFMYEDRRGREDILQELMKRKAPHILVTTQVCEVSLDVSYDVMYTEIAPLASIIQRFGRVNRYGRETGSVNVSIFDIQKPEPYEEVELEVSRKVLECFEGETLRNEWQLIERFDDVFTYEDLMKMLDEAGNSIDLDLWEDLTMNFFSLDLREEKVRKILEYRDRFTFLALPDPEIIADGGDGKGLRRKEEVSSLISKAKDKRKKTFSEWEGIMAKLKRFSVQVPIRYAIRALNKGGEVWGLPVVSEGLYSLRYGFLAGDLKHE